MQITFVFKYTQMDYVGATTELALVYGRHETRVNKVLSAPLAAGILTILRYGR